jgi:DNA polymerase II large subunit
MGESAEHRCFGTRLERVSSLDRIALEKQKDRLRSLERISKLHSHDRRVMLILEEEKWFWKLVAMHTSECHLSVVCGGSMSEGSYHLGS